MKSEVDDWLSELPPLDGADDEPAAEDGSHDDLLLEDEEAPSLDDAAADDLEVDDGVDIADDEPSTAEDDERWEADVGEPELDLLDDANDEGAEGDASGVGEGDLDMEDELPSSADDAGEEGTTDAIEQSLDEELPALDADDEGDFEDALMLETGLMVAQPEGPRWADEPWQRRPSADRALVLPVPDDDAVAGMAIGVAPDLLVSVTVAGRLLIDGGTPDSRESRPLPSAFALGKAGPPWVGLARRRAGQLIWVASRTGQIAQSLDLGRSWSSPIDVGKPILALALRADGSPVVLAGAAGGMEMLTLTEGSQWEAKSVIGRPWQLGAPWPLWFAVGESTFAIGDAGGVWVSRNGEDFTRVSPASGTTAGSFAGSASDAPVVFAEAPGEVEENARLLRASPDGRVEILAEIGPPDVDDRVDAPTVLAMAWDESTQSLRVAFSAVVCSVMPQSKA